MKLISKIPFLGILTVCTLVTIISYYLLCISGIRSDATIYITMRVEGTIAEDTNINEKINISKHANARITAITPEDEAQGNTKHCIHTTIYTTCISKFSVSNLSFQNKYLVSASTTQNSLKEYIGISNEQKTTLSGVDIFLP